MANAKTRSSRMTNFVTGRHVAHLPSIMAAARRMLAKSSLMITVAMTMSMTFNSQKYVVVGAKGKSTFVENGTPFIVLVTLKPAEGIHVNAQPPISVKLVDEPSAGEGSSTVLKVKNIPRRGDSLDSSKPVEVECEVSGAGSGERNIAFVVGYTFCSSKEGWCRMGSDTVSVTVRVKR